MMHLRVISPADRTAAVQELLIDDPGVTHVVVAHGAAIEPAGDLLTADVTREAVDELLERLTGLGLESDGAITVDPVGTTLSTRAVEAERAVPGDPTDAVLWAELVARTGEDSRTSVSFLAFLTIACVLGAVGAVTDSPVTVVGAMVLGPEFGPLAAISVGLVLRRFDLVRGGAVALGVGFPLAMAVTALAALVFVVTGLIPPDVLDRLQDVDFIYDVGPFSFIVALLAGAAGMLALTSAKSASLVGVFISVTTVPAAAVASVALVDGDLPRAVASAVQLLVNLVGIVVAASAVLAGVRHGRRRVTRRADRAGYGRRR